NGKLDRRALPAPERPSLAGRITEPRDAVEFQILSIWKRILKREEIGIDEDFFAAGGTSISAVKMMAAIEKQLGVILPVVTIFRARTVEAISKILRLRDMDVNSP